MSKIKKVLVTGANGFLAKNLIVHLERINSFEVLKHYKEDSINLLSSKANQADFVFHLAGVNRPENIADFKCVNVGLTETLCQSLITSGKSTPIFFSSSTQAGNDNEYGLSKCLAEKVIDNYSAETGSKSYIYRLPNLFGKWCKPNYNSVVATFCHNITRDIDIVINDKESILSLLYIDDVVEICLNLLSDRPKDIVNNNLDLLVHNITLGELAAKLYKYKNGRESLLTEKVGSGFERKLYSTYISYLPVEKFNYYLPVHKDTRGSFVEMLKTRDSGQFSFFTAPAGVTRGGHYHHTKTEKFLVLKGNAKFRFKNIITNEYYELCVDANVSQVVETIPGWSHDITNIGQDELIVMLWANEVFDKNNPDTFSEPLLEYKE